MGDADAILGSGAVLSMKVTEAGGARLRTMMSSPTERAHLHLVAPARSEAQPLSMDRSPLLRAQSPEGRTLLAARAAAVGRATLISGVPGSGKSSLLRLLIEDDISHGTGVLVVDPHGDLVDDLLAGFPAAPELRRRLVLFDPSDLERPPGLNLLDARSEADQDKAIQFMIDLFQDLYLADQQGPMLHQAVRNGMRLLMETGGTLPELSRLFSDRNFLRRKLAGTRDPWVRHFFENVWLTVSGSSRGEYLAYYTSKLSHFVEDRTLRNILGQRTGLDLSRCFARARVVFVTLSRGRVGDLNARLLGRIVLHKLERATVERAGLRTGARTPVNVYIDEFHELASPGVTTLLGAARKYAVGITLCTQRFEVLPAATQEALLGTVSHFVVFRQGDLGWASPLASALWPRFRERDLMLLPNYEAAAKVTRADGRALLGRVRVPRPPVAAPDTAGEIRRTMRRRAQPRGDIEADLRGRFLGDGPGEAVSGPDADVQG